MTEGLAIGQYGERVVFHVDMVYSSEPGHVLTLNLEMAALTASVNMRIENNGNLLIVKVLLSDVFIDYFFTF